MKKTGAKQPDQRMLWGILAAFVLICGAFSYSEFATPTPTVPPPAPVAAAAPAAANPAAVARSGPAPRPVPGMKADAARSLGTIGQLDPSLHMAAMDVTESLEYAGSGRNIFSPNSAPPPPRQIPAAVASPRPFTPPPPPTPTGPPPPPPPPPIDLKFFGTATSTKGKREAFLLHGDEVSVAGEGEVVSRRYKVLTVGTSSVVVEDMQYNNRQTLPVEVP